MRPLISVIIPSYNSGMYIQEALKSIINQSFTRWEAIIVDDGSTDDSVSLVESVMKNDTRFKLIKLGNNFGAASARNVGINAARGRWIAFLDSDDIWHPDKLERQFILLQTGASIVFSSYERISEDGKHVGIVRSRKSVRYKDALLGNPIGCLTAVWDTKVFGKACMPLLEMHEDYAFWLLLLREGGEAVGDTNILASYRVRSKSLSSGKLKSARAVWGILRSEPNMSKVRLLMNFMSYAIRSILKRVFWIFPKFGIKSNDRCVS